MNRENHGSPFNQGAACDELLRSYISAADEAEAQRQISPIIKQHAEPVVRIVVSYKLKLSFASANGSPDADDIVSEVTLILIERLQELRKNPLASPIRDFKAFVAALTYRACSDYLRRKHPQRLGLTNRMRYVLGKSPELALWKDERGDWLCGLARFRQRSEEQAARVEELKTQVSDLGYHLHSPESLREVFRRIGRPVRFNDIVAVASDFIGINEAGNSVNHAELDRLPDPKVSVETEVERRIYLQYVWNEITQLPVRQRRALLLNLTDHSGSGVIALLPVAGIASLRSIAKALEMSVEELGEIWNRLPLDDAAIAGQLGLTRQQVVNLRKSARERLARRTSMFSHGKTRDGRS